MSFQIDEITWNDLDMESVFNIIDHSDSSVGREYLKHVLQNIELDEEVLIERNKKISFFASDKNFTVQYKKAFKALGKTKKVSFLEYILEINQIKEQSNTKHYILIIVLLLSIAAIFFNPAFGIIALVAVIVINIATYFKDKSSVEAYFNCSKYLTNMLITADSILKIGLSEEFAEEKEKLIRSGHIFSTVKKNSWLITNSISGSIVDVILDYIRMLFHVDLIKFNNMQKCIVNNLDQVKVLFDALGEIEMCISIAEFRNDLEYFSIPDFKNNSVFNASELCHPLAHHPVPNSVKQSRSVLLTGSNASGKSTFLKAIAINQILGQSIYTCYARSFHTSLYKVITSMALSDNIFQNESYFIVEIKSMKRIFDNLGDVPVMAFIDEVLRGTNTKERIAASSQILKHLASSNALVFAATHDIELTEILSPFMDNYHFSESVIDDDVIFDYKLKEGKSTSCNAIKLLKIYGFDQNIVSESQKMVDMMDI